MKYLRQTDPRFQYLGSKVGLFLFLLGFAIIVMLGSLAWQQDIFARVVYLRTAPEHAQDVTPNMEVKLHGIRVGRVQSVLLDDRGKPLVVLKVKKKDADWLTDEASVRLSGVEPLGTPYLALQTGQGQGEWPEEQLLQFDRDLNFGETMTAIQNELKPVIAQMASLMTILSSEDGEVRRTLRNVAGLSEDIARRVPALLLNTEEALGATNTIVTQLAAEEGELFRTLRSASGMSSEVEDRLPTLIAEMEASVASLRRTMAEIETTTKNASPEVTELITTSRETAKKADRFLSDLRQIWFLKMFFPRQQPPEE